MAKASHNSDFKRADPETRVPPIGIPAKITSCIQRFLVIREKKCAAARAAWNSSFIVANPDHEKKKSVETGECPGTC